MTSLSALKGRTSRLREILVRARLPLTQRINHLRYKQVARQHAFIFVNKNWQHVRNQQAWSFFYRGMYVHIIYKNMQSSAVNNVPVINQDCYRLFFVSPNLLLKFWCHKFCCQHFWCYKFCCHHFHCHIILVSAVLLSQILLGLFWCQLFWCQKF